MVDEDRAQEGRVAVVAASDGDVMMTGKSAGWRGSGKTRENRDVEAFG